MEEKTSRPDLDEYFLTLAKTAASRSTCRHRQQGTVLVRGDRVISMGYNGSPPGQLHCLDTDCAKVNAGYCRAEGLHGESNAIASAAKMGISTDGAIAYCVYSPCRSCCNLLKSAGIVAVTYVEEYPGFPKVRDYLLDLGITPLWLKRK